MTTADGKKTICTRKVRTEEEGEFQAKEILKNFKDAIKIEYYSKKGELTFIQQHIEDLKDELDYEKRKYEMDLYNAGIVDIMDTY